MSKSQPPPPPPPSIEMSFSDYITQEVDLDGHNTVVAAYMAAWVHSLRPDIPEHYAYDMAARLIHDVYAGNSLEYEDIHRLSAIMEEVSRPTMVEGEESH